MAWISASAEDGFLAWLDLCITTRSGAWEREKCRTGFAIPSAGLRMSADAGCHAQNVSDGITNPVALRASDKAASLGDALGHAAKEIKRQGGQGCLNMP